MQAVAVAFIILFATALYGWGLLFRRYFQAEGGVPAITIVLGLPPILFIGTLFCLFHVAGPISLLGLVAFGLISPFLLVRRYLLDRGWKGARANLLAHAARWRWHTVALIAILLLFTIATQLPPRSYNFADDFQKYFAFPVRLLQTGTLVGSDLNSLGAETLGGLALLQALALSILPFEYLNAMDAVFGLGLCLCLTVSFVAQSRTAAAIGFAVVAAAAFINPMYVNISALYLGSALILSVLGLTADLRESPSQPNTAAIGALYGVLIIFKTTFLLFAVIHVLAVSAVLALASRKPAQALNFLGKTVIATLVMLSPWLLLHASHYLAALQAAAETHPFAAETHTAGLLDLFSFDSVLYGDDGDSFGLYTLILACATLAAVLAVRLARGGDETKRASAHMLLAAALAGCAAYVILIVVLGPKLSGPGQSLRYFTPFAIGLVPGILGLAAVHLADETSAKQKYVLWAAAALPVLVFVPSFVYRADQAINSGSIIAFPYARTEGYGAYNDYVLKGQMQERVRQLQNFIPAGATITAWIRTPFYLDFARNPIADANTAGLSAPWAEIPNSEYMIWEYAGMGAPPMPPDEDHIDVDGHQDKLSFLKSYRYAKSLEKLLTPQNVIYNDGQGAVFRLPPSAGK